MSFRLIARATLCCVIFIVLMSIIANTIINHQESVGIQENPQQTSHTHLHINPEGKTIIERVRVPEGFSRIEVESGSFGEYLRNLPLKPHGSKVMYYNGEAKMNDVHEAVIDIDIGNRDLQQCADAVIRLKAEYLYQQKEFDKIRFNFTNGFNAEYSRWIEGYRIEVKENDVSWKKTSEYSIDYKDFRKYLDMVFAYAGTLSLSKELKPVTIDEMTIGDVFIQGGTPGHCVIVVDIAESRQSGQKIFLLAQSYMPAQDIHILKNLNDQGLSPWYHLTSEEVLHTPEWNFKTTDLKRFEP
jgi:hypothetical protein